MNGHIKLHRALTEWGWYKDLPTCKLWLHVLLRANYKACEWKGIEIPRGAFATSYTELAAESGLSVQQVRTALGKLKKTGEITVETNRHYTVITVSKYDEYQSTERDEVTTPAKCSPKPKPKPKAQEADKKLDLTERFSEPVCSAVQDWIRYKKERRDAYEPTGLRNLLTMIENRVKQHGEQAVAEVIRLSMSQGWKGIIWDRIGDKPKKTKTDAPMFDGAPAANDWENEWAARVKASRGER